MKQVRWLTARAIEAIHYDLIMRYGGVDGVRDAGGLQSALARPKHLLAYQVRITVPQLAAAYGWSFLRNHAFIDGNKRIALASIIVFLDLNGWEWNAREVEETAQILSAAAGEMSESEWIRWVESNAGTTALNPV